ncbi:alpha/beta hydrolase [Paenibacillus xerothermodurans]|uniref:Alpha/beta hydrolase n=1 Tax=Paenibacillus xerothermodurans TaxID=1977292 RepID=A0A2W1N7I7_PAEXE|nr:alpha/beta hydrolase [Paenibacillus xerothermodurans]PZE20579.1 alpha/beta hydrolase [Paenibacillus xerothermodurans]
MIHLYQQATEADRPTLVLFHGTGGTERDLLPLSQLMSPGSAVLSLRGNVLENGMPRFFRRLGQGVFDEVDLVHRTKEVHKFLDKAAEQYGFDRANVAAVGYSNGANIIASLVFHFPNVLRAAILHHPMVPLWGRQLPNLFSMPVFIGAGTNDPICSPAETDELKKLLTQAGAAVTVHWEQHGHQLTRPEVEAAAAWYHAEVL